MINEEIRKLVDKYFKKDKYQFPKHFENRYDEDSSAICYSLIRHFKPENCLEIGTWLGGSTCLIMSALLKNKKDFLFIASEISDDLREKTRINVLEKCGQTPILIRDIMETLDMIPKKLDFLFIDTDHDLEVTEWIVANLFPRVKKDGLVAIHDFAVEEIDGKWIGKAEGGKGGLPETQYYMDLYEQKKLPLKKLYWNYHNPYYEGGYGDWEASFWLKK